MRTAHPLFSIRLLCLPALKGRPHGPTATLPLWVRSDISETPAQLGILQAHVSTESKLALHPPSELDSRINPREAHKASTSPRSWERQKPQSWVYTVLASAAALPPRRLALADPPGCNRSTRVLPGRCQSSGPRAAG